MGLGKTCQSCIFLSWLKHIGDSDQPHLVVAPASVLDNWMREFEKFAPSLQVVKYHGSIGERGELQDKMLRSSFDVVLAPITYFQRERSDDRVFLKRFDYTYLLVDEAHLLKNAKGTRYKSLNRFQTRHRLLLTGTPVQNSPKELMSLLCFLMPLFARKANSFDDSDAQDGGENMLQHFVSLQDTGKDDRAAYAKLKQLFSPFVLRRKKIDVLAQIMPRKTRRAEFVKLDPTARSVYDSILTKHIQAKRKGGSIEHLFTQLRKAAHHPLLLRTRHVEETEKAHMASMFHKYGAFRGEACTKAKVREELEKYSDFEIHLTAYELIEENKLRRNDLERYVLDSDDLFCSAKCVHLRKILPELINNGHRILIFSVWTTCLDLLSCLLEQMDLSYLRMDGSTAVSDRQDLIDQFNRDTSIPIFLLSTKACGLGINLTAADTCIMHDLDFNPFNDLQAEDRCHRIGQKREVTVIKLVAKDTVDEDVFDMQERKSKMNAAIMDNDTQAKQQATKDKRVVLQSAVDRFLKSPAEKKARGREKENIVVGTNSCAATTTELSSDTESI